MILFPAMLFALLLSSLPGHACGVDTDCTLGDRTYRIQMPDAPSTQPTGALIFAHGYKGSARGTMRNTSLQALADRLGVALVAPDAIMDDWSIPNAPKNGTSKDVDELSYFDALKETLVTTHAIDPDRILVAGFSAGGMMVWNLACARPGDYAGFVPIAGTFLAPEPTRCENPSANLIHIHGTSDKIVPLKGRPIAETHQGDVDKALAMYVANGGYSATDAPHMTSDLSCENWRNGDNAMVMKCLHDGGHSFKVDHIEAAWKLLMP
ncbi:MAG: PHB depolymerase family esterase [Pseudomonadota bacterium]